MCVLGDSELKARLGAGEILRYASSDAEEGRSLTAAEIATAVRAASLNLTIGLIYVPQTEPGAKGSADKPKQSHVLRPGRTVIVKTREELMMPKDCAGVVFTRPALASKGVLLTNPGHIDPGYRGDLSFTLINMGTEDLPLRKNEALANLTVMTAQGVESDWANRNPEPDHEVQASLDALSHDFMQVELRARSAAQEQLARDTLKTSVIITVLFLVITIASVVLAFSMGSESVNDLDDRLSQVESSMKSSPEPSASTGDANAPAPPATGAQQ